MRSAEAYRPRGLRMPSGSTREGAETVSEEGLSLADSEGVSGRPYKLVMIRTASGRTTTRAMNMAVS